MKLSEELIWRGQVKDKTFEDLGWLDEPRTFYLGMDCSSDSLTIGNLATLMLARRLLDAGWKTVLLAGGATSLIGDPGGKDEERSLKSREEIQANVTAIKRQVEKLFSSKEHTLVDNLDWFENVRYLDFLRDVGKNFSMTELVQRDFIASRMGEGGGGISYAEFSYSLIQGYDFWHLYKNYGVVLQIGGSDQWGNMLSGVPLVRKKEGVEVHAMSAPLVINKVTGKKFGKSEDGAIWLDENQTSVYRFYQFWLNVDDEDVIDHMKVYTLLSPEEINTVETQFNENRRARLAQKTLAYEVTKLVHGQDRADSVRRISETLFGGGDYRELTDHDFEQLKEELPFAEGGERPIIDLLGENNLATSRNEARQFLNDNAVYINGQQIPLEKTQIDESDTVKGYVLIRRGKNHQMIYRVKQ